MPRLLGVDVDSKKVRFVVADLRFRRMQVLKSGEIVLPEDRMQFAAAFSEAMMQWKKDFAPSGVIMGIPLRWFSWTYIDLPLMGGEDVRRAIRFELEKHLPLSVDEYRFDFLSTKAENRIRALVFSVKKDVVDACARAVSDAGMHLVSIRCRTVDLLNSVAGILNAVPKRGIFVYASDEDFEIVALESKGTVQVKRVSHPSDLRREVQSFLQQIPGRVHVAGDFEQQLQEQLMAENVRISSAHALIMSCMRRKRFALEFAPPELARQKKDYYPYALAGCAAAALVFFLLTGFVAYLRDVSALNAIEERLGAIRAQAAGVIEARKKLEALQEERRVLGEFLDHSNEAIRALSELSGTVPADTWLINLSLDDKRGIEMEGFSRKTAELVLALEKSGRFQSISFSAPIISREGEERFSLKLEVKGK